MEVRVLALTNNHYIISYVDEVATADIGEPDCNLQNLMLSIQNQVKLFSNHS